MTNKNTCLPLPSPTLFLSLSYESLLCSSKVAEELYLLCDFLTMCMSVRTRNLFLLPCCLWGPIQRIALQSLVVGKAGEDGAVLQLGPAKRLVAEPMAAKRP